MRDPETFQDAFNLLCGDKIGYGIHRNVFECRLFPDCIIKVEIGEVWRSFANVKEWGFWNYHRDVKAVSPWLAPCRWISPDGYILIQERAVPVGLTEPLPDRLPAFLTDIKRENFGRINGKLVCVDYALTIDNVSTRHRKVQWA